MTMAGCSKKRKVCYGAVAFITLFALAMLLPVCRRYMVYGYLWVRWGVAEWQQDVKNSWQRRSYTEALRKKLDTGCSMISLYDDHITPQGKKRSNDVRQCKCVTLFSDGSFVALDSRHSGYSWPNVTVVSGVWLKDGETFASLRRHDGTNLINYAFVDLASATNFPSPPVTLPWRVSATYETQRALLLNLPIE